MLLSRLCKLAFAPQLAPERVQRDRLTPTIAVRGTGAVMAPKKSPKRCAHADDSRAHFGCVAPRLRAIEGSPLSHLRSRSPNTSADLPGRRARRPSTEWSRRTRKALWMMVSSGIGVDQVGTRLFANATAAPLGTPTWLEPSWGATRARASAPGRPPRVDLGSVIVNSESWRPHPLGANTVKPVALRAG
jgi:hypothetical protein